MTVTGSTGCCWCDNEVRNAVIEWSDGICSGSSWRSHSIEGSSHCKTHSLSETRAEIAEPGNYSRIWESCSACNNWRAGETVGVLGGHNQKRPLASQRFIIDIVTGSLISVIPFNFVDSTWTEPRTCQDLKKLGVEKSGLYQIDPDGPGIGDAPITVECEMSGDSGNERIQSSQHFTLKKILIWCNLQVSLRSCMTLWTWPMWSTVTILAAMPIQSHIRPVTNRSKHW